MKITKRQLKKLIQEEIERFEEESAPSELVKSWTSEIETWIQTQFDSSFPLEGSGEIPAIIKALEQVRVNLKDSSSTGEFRE